MKLATSSRHTSATTPSTTGTAADPYLTLEDSSTATVPGETAAMPDGFRLPLACQLLLDDPPMTPSWQRKGRLKGPWIFTHGMAWDHDHTYHVPMVKHFPYHHIISQLNGWFYPLHSHIMQNFHVADHGTYTYI